MKNHIVTGLLIAALAGVAATANAQPIMTAGSDFIAASPADAANVEVGVVGLQNVGTAQATVIGTVKREPASSPDGSQVVTLDFYNPGGVNFNGTVWAYSSNQNFFGEGYFQVSGNPNRDPVGWVTKTMTFTSSEINNTSYYEAVVYLPPKASIYGAQAN